MKLGKLIGELSKFDGWKRIMILINGKYENPAYLHSYRGYYDHLAIDYETDEKRKVESLLKECREAIGKTFYGYKGGDFVMSEYTPVWISEDGRAENWIISEIVETGDGIIIKTASNDYE